MPIFGVRMENGVPVTRLSLSKEVLNQRNTHLIYPEGEYNITPAKILLPRVKHILHVYRENPNQDKTVARYSTIPLGIGDIVYGMMEFDSKGLM